MSNHGIRASQGPPVPLTLHPKCVPFLPWWGQGPKSIGVRVHGGRCGAFGVSGVSGVNPRVTPGDTPPNDSACGLVSNPHFQVRSGLGLGLGLGLGFRV